MKDNSSKNRIKCPHCSKLHRADARFCTTTGKTIQKSGTQRISNKTKTGLVKAPSKNSHSRCPMLRCPNCGKLYVDSRPNFCNKCGFKLPDFNVSDKQAKPTVDMPIPKEKKKEKDLITCPHPGCEAKLRQGLKYCRTCFKKIVNCKKCKTYNRAGEEVCIGCGKKIETADTGNWLMFKGNPARDGNSLDVIVPPLAFKWRYPNDFKPEPILGSPIAYRGIVYFGSTDMQLHAVNQYNGESLWKRPTNGTIVSTPAIWDNIIYMASCDGRVYAQEASKGRPEWVYPTGSANLLGRVKAPVLACEAGVFVATENGEVFCLDLKKGFRKWSVLLDKDYQLDSTEDSVKIAGGPAYFNKKVFVATVPGKVYCLNSDDGKILWQFPEKKYDHSAFIATPAIAGKLCFIPNRGGNFYALDIQTGKDIWNSTVQIEGVVEGSPAVGFGKVIVGSLNQYLTALNFHTGGNVWMKRNFKLRILDTFFSTPIITLNELIFVGSDSGYIYCREIESGEEIWKYKFDIPIKSSPVVSDGFLYVTTNSGYLYAFSEK
ncbi:MAG: PQQ-binding-like beta-propeller repeat protein [Vulcanimicrobiota bacterium]